MRFVEAVAMSRQEINLSSVTVNRVVFTVLPVKGRSVETRIQ